MGRRPPDVTGVTGRECCSLPYMLGIFAEIGRTVVRESDTAGIGITASYTRGTTMFAFGVFAALVLVLVAAAGRPYRQSWHNRFGETRP